MARYLSAIVGIYPQRPILILRNSASFMINSTIDLDSLDQVEFRIYTIGYSRQGESILALLCENDRIIYSILTDSFQKQSKGNKVYNALDDIFLQYQNPRIDLFIWTHPDLDHSIGIQYALVTFDATRNAFVFLPDGLDRKDKYELCGLAKDAFDYINTHYIQKTQALPISVSSKEERGIVKLRLKERMSGASVNVDFWFLAPSGEIVLKRSAQETSFTINEMSIVYAVNLNGQNFLFTGDFEGKNIKMMGTDHMELLRFLKIPHHASFRSQSTVNKLLQLNAGNVVQTVTQKASTPDNDELNNYLKLGKVYVASDDTKQDNQYGYVLIRYGVKDVNLIEPIGMVGNAHQHVSVQTLGQV